MPKFNLFVLDDEDSYHCIETCNARDIDVAVKKFVSDDEPSEEGRFEVDYIGDDESTIVDYRFDPADGCNALTYVITPREKPSTRREMFA